MLRKLSPIATLCTLLLLVGLFITSQVLQYGPLEVNTRGVDCWNLTGSFFDVFPNWMLCTICVLLLILIAIQCSRISLISILYSRSRSYVGSLIYLLMVAVCANIEGVFDLYQLIGIYIGTLGIMQGMRSILLKSGMAVRRMYAMSFCMGFSVLVYPPMIWFAPLVPLMLLFFRSFEWREYFVGFFTMFVPMLFYFFILWILEFDCLGRFSQFLSTIYMPSFTVVDYFYSGFVRGDVPFFVLLCRLIFTVSLLLSILWAVILVYRQGNYFKRRGRRSLAFFSILSLLCLVYLVLPPLPLMTILPISFLPFSVVFPVLVVLSHRHARIVLVLDFLVLFSALFCIISPLF